MLSGTTVLLIYAVLMVVGGAMGMRAGSKASLIAGGSSGVLLLIAWGVTFVNLAAGLWAGAVIALLLTATFAGRVAKTRKFMPSGMLLAVSLIATIMLIVSAKST
jgi:uncharacterized membrane protein (UPF0136 family)